MGLGERTLELLKLGARTAAANTSPTGSTPTAPISVWQEGGPGPMILWDDLYGFNRAAAPITKLEALRVPAVAKARAILHALIVGRPLRAMTRDGMLPPADQPTWLYRSDSGVSPQGRLAAILDDLIFHEASVLAVARGSIGQITDAVHVPYDRWHVDADGFIFVDNQMARSDEVIHIPGPGPGLLWMAGDTIRAARDMDAAWIRRVRTPLPSIILQEREDNGMTETEARDYVTAVAKARRSEDGAVMFIPYALTADTVPASETTDLYVEGRNALRLDIGNFFNLPAALLDGSVSTASLTYSTQEGRRNEVFDYSIQYWSGPVEAALSMDNVCPRGQRIRFDWTDYESVTAAPTGPIVED